MPTTSLFNDGTHRNLLLEDSNNGEAVQANQHLIVHGDVGMLLDPGGHKVYASVLAQTFSELGGARLEYLFLSHQCPDIVAAINGWLMSTDAEAWISKLWTRFVAHFGIDRLVIERLKSIPDDGMRLKLGDSEMLILPAHFMHSPGNFHLYDPISKILYTGDLGASIGQDYIEVPDFDAHLKYMDGFHRRYMASSGVLRAWADMVRQLDVQTIAPQHGAMMIGPEMSRRFIDWIASIDCHFDSPPGHYKIPA